VIAISDIQRRLSKIPGALYAIPPEIARRGEETEPREICCPEDWVPQASVGLAIANHREEWVGGNVPDPSELFEFAPGIDQERVEAALGGERGDAIARATEIHGVDALAWYVPFHAIGAKWGIYISTAGILYLISRVFQETDASLTAKLQMSVRALHQHEIFHLARERLTSYICQFSMAGKGLITGLSYRQMLPKPFSQSFWVHEGLLCAGSYPGDLNPQTRDAKLRGLLECRIGQVLSPMEEGEKGRNGRPFEPYTLRLAAIAAEQDLSVQCVRLPIRAHPLLRLRPCAQSTIHWRPHCVRRHRSTCIAGAAIGGRVRSSPATW